MSRPLTKNIIGRLCCFYLLCAGFTSCGVEIGNPSTTPEQPRDTPVTGAEDLALLASEGLSEISELSLGTESIQGFSLIAPEITRSARCEEIEGGVLLEKSASITDEKIRGRVERFQRKIAITAESDSQTTITSDEALLRCVDGERPDVNLRQLASLTMQRDFNNSGTTVKTVNTSGATVSTRSFQRAGTHTLTVERLSMDSNQIVTRETHTASGSKTLSGERGATTFSYSLANVIAAATPLVLEKTRSNDGLTLNFVSGIQSSTLSDGSLLSITYAGLIINAGDCQPLSGGAKLSFQSAAGAEITEYDLSVVEGQIVMQAGESTYELDIDLCQF